VYGQEKKKAAQYTLHTVLHRILQLLAPIIPHLTEEIFQTMYAEQENLKSIHLSSWPAADEKRINEDAEKQGDLLTIIITEIRREKAEKHLPLNAKIAKMTIYAGSTKTVDLITQGREDIAGTCKIQQIIVLAEAGTGRQVKPYDVYLATEY
jgi:valyl-tRNA synthetase